VGVLVTETFLYQESTVPAFQDALIDLLKVRQALQGVAIVPGPPAPGIAQTSQWICLLEVDGSEKWAAMGRLSKEENYTQKVYISVITRDGEGDARASRDIAYALRAEVSEQLRETPTVNDVVWQCQIEGKNQFFPRLGITQTDPHGKSVVDLSYREAALYFEISVKNRMLHV
jgi:hypothetical protein